jgi:hypothetical protein
MSIKPSSLERSDERTRNEKNKMSLAAPPTASHIPCRNDVADANCEFNRLVSGPKKTKFCFSC